MKHFKPPHDVDKAGYPIDPTLRAFQRKLGDLAAQLREVSRGIDGQLEIVEEYHAVMEKLYSLGWDDVLDIEAELPDEYMPEEYLRRHPTIE